MEAGTSRRRQTSPATTRSSARRREVRLALVLNGGVSLAVWIGGVTAEIDSIRFGRVAEAQRRRPVASTARLYGRLLELLGESVRIDVIAGASAGGINGALLAAAVFAQEPLPSLRDVWITIGDFTKLLRSPSTPQPPSLLRGDDFVLPQLVDRFKEILEGVENGPEDQPVYLYVTGTDFYGVEKTFSDSTERRFSELDHRRIFSFQHDPESRGRSRVPAAAQKPKTGEMPTVGSFSDGDAAALLASAARASSSFPFAFEAHPVTFADGSGLRWLIDGGVLDNQPFVPVLNRIATMPAKTTPVRRVLAFVVPYVTEPGGVDSRPVSVQPAATATVSAANSLPRDLPRLVDLERVSAEIVRQRQAQHAQERLDMLQGDGKLQPAAESLFEAYRSTRHREVGETLRHWASPQFPPGEGEIAQSETLTVEQVFARTPPSAEPFPAYTSGERYSWLPDEPTWSEGQRWNWGLTPSERVAADALRRLRVILAETPGDGDAAAARETASQLVASIRQLKLQTFYRFRRYYERFWLAESADRAYRPVSGVLAIGFANLATELDKVRQAPSLQDLLYAEIVQNAVSADAPGASAAFDFLHVSAGIRNALGHPDTSPATKLAGIKLNHFAGFLKRSWRANDWMWGRLDGVQYLVAAVLDQEYLQTAVRSKRTLYKDLAAFAFEPEAEAVLETAWERTLNWARNERLYPDPETKKAVCERLTAISSSGSAAEQLARLLKEVAKPAAEHSFAMALLDVARAPIAARIQLQILRDELPEIRQAIQQDAAAGASRNTAGNDWATNAVGDSPHELVERFRSLRLGRDETPMAEASSKLGMDVISTGAAVATAALAGGRGGLPAAVRAPLAFLRALTLVFNLITRLLVRTPAVGVAAVVVAAVGVVWALTQPNATLSAALPALAAAAVGGATVLLTMATSPLEAGARTWKHKAGLVLLALIPVVLVLFVFAPPFGLHDDRADRALGGASQWLDRKCGSVAVDLAGCAMFAALAAAVVRLLAERYRRGRTLLIWGWRWAFIAAAAAIAGGAAYIAISHKSGAWKTTMPFLLLFGAISLAPIFAAIAEGGRWLIQRRRFAS